MNTDKTHANDRATRLTGWSLLAMAIVLGSMVLTRVAGTAEPTAHAEMVIDKGSFTVMTARYSNDIEYLYLLDSRSGALIAYLKDPGGVLIERSDMLDVNASFDRALKLLATSGGNPTGTRIDR